MVGQVNDDLESAFCFPNNDLFHFPLQTLREYVIGHFGGIQVHWV